jgi:crotonobetainyl-CoA:carnitine CoA-transferase CaiB-like acyl-CoA transferase
MSRARGSSDRVTAPGPGGPLAGVRVVDLSRALAGPYATMMLADAGADVIKVERPDGGDDTRSWGPPFVDADGEQVATYFLSVNRNKRSVVLDLGSELGLARLHDLIVGADVLVENFRPGVMERLGLAPSELAQRYPGLVVLSVTGFGEGGPDGGRAGFDQIIQGEAGLMSLTGAAEGEPTRIGVPITDILAGMFGAYGVVAALRERERSGRGQRVTTSLLAAAVAVHTFQGTRWTVSGEIPGRTGNRHPTIAPYGSFRCRDGWITLAVGSDSLWRRFAPLVGIDPDEPGLATNRDRFLQVEALEARIEAVLRDRDVEEWMTGFERAGIPAGRIRTLDEVYAWTQVEHLGLVETVTHPRMGSLRMTGSPIRWSRSGRPESAAPPLLGQDQDLIDDPGGAWRDAPPSGADYLPG